MDSKGKSILVVEDDPKIRNLVKIYLVMLPEFSGEELCEWIREE